MEEQRHEDVGEASGLPISSNMEDCAEYGKRKIDGQDNGIE